MLKVSPRKGVVHFWKTGKVKPEKCLSNEPLAVPLDEIHIDDKHRFVEESVEILDREFKRLKRSRIPIIKVRWNSKRGPEFTWEREDQFQEKAKHGQILNETSNKAKIKKEIEAFETINIELEHTVAKLLTENEHLNKENETLKKHYKDLYDSIKITRSKTIEQTTSLLANNADLKAQIQEKLFAIAAAFKNDLGS
ncbi:hypothetical protein Tco_1369312 [Tanacetum coccineum]